MFCSKQQPDELSFAMADTNSSRSNDQGPSYYKRGSGDTWDFIRGQGLNFHLGNAIKYIVRAGYKDDKAEDLRKAIHYLENEIEHTTDTGEGVPKFLRDHELEEQAKQSYAEDPDSGGVQRVFGSGGYAFPAESTDPF